MYKNKLKYMLLNFFVSRVYWVILVAWWNDDVVADIVDDVVADVVVVVVVVDAVVVVVVEANELVQEEPFSDTEKAETWEARWQ